MNGQAAPLSPAEKTQIRQVLSVVYGNQAKHWHINMQVWQLFGQLMKSSKGCSRAMDYVPRPLVAGDPVKWASKQVRGIILRRLLNRGRPYLVCLRASGLKMKSEFVMASLGI